MNSERNEGEIQAEYADNFVKTIPLKKVDLREVPEIDLETGHKKMFYVGDFLKRYFGGRVLGATVLEAERMCTKFSLWQKSRIKSLELLGRTDEKELVKNIDIPFIDEAIQGAYGFHMDTVNKMKGLGMDYWQSFNYWVDLKTISEEAVTIWKERETQRNVAPLSVFSDKDALDTASAVKKFVDGQMVKFSVEKDTHMTQTDLEIRTIRDNYVRGFIDSHFNEEHMESNRNGARIFREELPRFRDTMEKYVAEGARQEVWEALDGLDYGSVIDFAERNINYITGAGRALNSADRIDYKSVRFWRIILEQVRIAQISDIQES